MDKILPWKQRLSPIRKHYPKVGNERRPYDLESMLRIYFMQQWYQLSDPAMENSLDDIESMRRFTKLNLDKTPDECTILGFCHLLEKHELTLANHYGSTKVRH